MKRILWLTLVLGVWLIVAPFVLGYSVMFGATANDVVFGIVLIACSWMILATVAREIGIALVQALCSLWLIVAPFALAYQAGSAAMVNDVFVGIVALSVTMVVIWSAAPVKAA
jgi:hypothetical protein